MDDGINFNLNGLDKHIEKIIHDIPDEGQKKLTKMANKFKKQVKAITPISSKDHKKKLNKSYKSKIEGIGSNIRVDIWSNSPLFHLIERGHKIVRNGKVIGFYNGKHMMQQTYEDYKNKYPEEIESWVEDMINKLEK